jgi:hypothetical protein
MGPPVRRQGCGRPAYRLVADGDGFAAAWHLGAMMHADGRHEADGTLALDLGGEAMRLVPATAPAFDPADYAGAYDGCDIPSRHVVRADGAGLVIDYGPGGDRGAPSDAVHGAGPVLWSGPRRRRHRPPLPSASTRDDGGRVAQRPRALGGWKQIEARLA